MSNVENGFPAVERVTPPNGRKNALLKRQGAKKTNGTGNGVRKARLLDFFYTDIAIDLGTANTLIVSRDGELLLNEPSIIALNGNGVTVAFGHQARMIHEKTHKGIRTVRPMRDGVIADYEVADLLIGELIRTVKRKWYSTTRKMVICVPYGITEVERRAVCESARHAGARKIYLVEEPMAAAIGSDIDVHAPQGSMIVDIGGGTTEIAVISLGGIVHAQSLRLGGDMLNEAIVHYLRRKHNLLIGDRSAERLKCTIASAVHPGEELEETVKGRDLVNGMPRTRSIRTSDLMEAIDEPVRTITESVLKSLEQTPPELAVDLIDSGIVLAGGGGLLKNLDRRIAEATGLPVHLAEDPLTAVVRGTGRILTDLDHYRPLLTVQ